MRPHCRRHSRPARALHYVLRPGARILGGTFPVPRRDRAPRRWQQISPVGDVIHVTLSLPPGLVMPPAAWLETARTALRELGLDPAIVPWIAARHVDTECDHIHICVGALSFTGRPMDPVLTRTNCDRVHQLLADRLGLWCPDYALFDVPNLAPPVPDRRIKTPRHIQLAKDLASVFRQDLPEDLAALDAAMRRRPGAFRLHLPKNKYGATSYAWADTRGENPITGGALGR